MIPSAVESATEILAWLTGLGIRVEAVGGDLRLRPSDKVTPEVIERVRACKAELLRAVPRPGAPPGPATILRHCRCIDCQHWAKVQGICLVNGFMQHVPHEDRHVAMQPFWTDLGMVRPKDWHYCADYQDDQCAKIATQDERRAFPVLDRGIQEPSPPKGQSPRASLGRSAGGLPHRRRSLATKKTEHIAPEKMTQDT